MEYMVQKGDTIAKVTGLMNTDWQTLKAMNPSAVGKSTKNGNWFVREGARVSVDKPFEQVLQAEVQERQAPRSGAEATGTLYPSGETMHTVRPGDTIWELSVKRYHVDPEEVMRLNNITDARVLQPGMRLRIPQPEKIEAKEVVASWYGEYHHGRPMANGEPYNMYGATIAHKKMPLGTKVELENPETGEKVKAVVTDRGPYVAGRDVDLSYQLAKKLSLVEQGVGHLVMRTL